MGHNFEVSRYAMPMGAWGAGKIIRWIWDSRPNAGVWPALIVMRNPVSQNSPQVIFSQRDEKVQALSAKCANYSFTDAVGYRASIRCPEYSKTHMCNGTVELQRKNTIAIVDEKTVAMIRGYGFPQLLECPHCRRVGCYIAVHNPPCLVFDND